MVVVDRRLWLNADRTRLVEDGHQDAAFLWAVPGRRVSDDEAEQYGYRPLEDDEPDEQPDEPDDDTDEVDEKPDTFACPVDGCDFEAKTAAGLSAHKRSH